MKFRKLLMYVGGRSSNIDLAHVKRKRYTYYQIAEWCENKLWP